MRQCGAPDGLPGGGNKAVAVALGKTVAGGGVAGHRLFQHLRLLALMLNAGKQPKVAKPADADFDLSLDQDLQRIIDASMEDGR